MNYHEKLKTHGWMQIQNLCADTLHFSAQFCFRQCTMYFSQSRDFDPIIQSYLDTII